MTKHIHFSQWKFYGHPHRFSGGRLPFWPRSDWPRSFDSFWASLRPKWPDLPTGTPLRCISCAERAASWSSLACSSLRPEKHHDSFRPGPSDSLRLKTLGGLNGNPTTKPTKNLKQGYGSGCVMSAQGTRRSMTRCALPLSNLGT